MKTFISLKVRENYKGRNKLDCNFELNPTNCTIIKIEANTSFRNNEAGLGANR